MNVLPLLLIGVVACSAAADDGADDGASAVSAQKPMSYVGEAVSGMLANKYPGEKGSTWNLARDGKLSGDFVKQFPPRETWGKVALPVATRCDATQASCDKDYLLTTCSTDSDCPSNSTCQSLKSTIAHRGDSAKKLCAGHSESRIDDIWDVITTAKTTLDISSLSPPDGRFEAGVRNAITFASEVEHPPQVRMIFGDFWGSGLEVPGRISSVLASLTRDVAPGSPIDVTVTAYTYGAASWDHSKIIARDGEYALVGGANMWDVHYLGTDPVHDMWISIEGSPAADAQRFVDRAFQFACNDVGLLDTVKTSRRGPDGCPATFAQLQPKGGARSAGGSSPVIAVGRTGFAANPSDDAFIAMIDASKTKIHLSQQDIGPIKRAGLSFGSWPEDTMKALLRAMGRGVEIDFTLSNTGAVPGSLGAIEALYNTYDNGWTPTDVAQHFIDLATANPDLIASGEDPHAVVCRQLQLMRLRSSTAQTWPDEGTLANHVKAIMVDDKAFYVGSQNIYAANLTEFGYIVDDEAATKTFISSYLANEEKFSRRTAVSGPGVICGF